MRYLVLGASAASVSCAKTLRELDENAKITVVSKDTDIYSRCMLHHIISDHKTLEELNFAGKDFFKEYDINWISGVYVEQIDTINKKVLVEDNIELDYDKLFIGTGASSFIPPIENLRQANNVYGLRNIGDAYKIKEKIKNIKNVAVLGAGLVGIDAVSGMLDKNINISLVEMNDRILPLQLDSKASSRYEELFKQKGVNIYKGVKATKVNLKDNNVAGLYLDNGEIIDCEMIIVAAGVRPNISFIKDNTINIDMGICINSKCETNVEDIYSGGDVTASTPIWPIAVKQGIVAAYNMVSKDREIESLFSFRNSMNFLGLDTVSIGLVDALDNTYSVDIIEDKDIYKKIIHKDGVIYGALLQGDISYCGVLKHLISEKIDISGIDKNIFEIDYSDFFYLKENGEYEYKI
ncbi:NAD(P)/FAD-dependent oxidoreductase [Tepidibacter aestuarii]|uniref:NAD(P)/FAD-dependent oxidoreductase n=1 Tax=Tepidibacter aestuarii TaxID=2925782 RepID=UPI0020C0B5CB|nr:FAD-dependent oxidoreductase [Tepidibacter aestuarii]CAH2214899.1 Pyridine nucleotide-disulphide oxidoreductase [Tepidibacter aestuarii]